MPPRGWEGVEGFDDAVLGVAEGLVDAGDGDAVVDGDLDGLLLDLELPAEPAVGHEQARRVSRPGCKEGDEGGEEEAEQGDESPRSTADRVGRDQAGGHGVSP